MSERDRGSGRDEGRKPNRTPGPTREGDSLADVVEMLLDKGIVINADIAVSVGETELLGVHIRAAIASFETAAEYGLQFPDGTDMQRVEAASGRTEMHSKGGSPLAVGSPGTPAGGPSPSNPVEGSDEDGEGDADANTDADADGDGGEDVAPETGDGDGESDGAEGDADRTDDDSASEPSDGEGATTDDQGKAARDSPSSEVDGDAS